MIVEDVGRNFMERVKSCVLLN